MSTCRALLFFLILYSPFTSANHGPDAAPRPPLARPRCSYQEREGAIPFSQFELLAWASTETQHYLDNARKRGEKPEVTLRQLPPLFPAQLATQISRDRASAALLTESSYKRLQTIILEGQASMRRNAEILALPTGHSFPTLLAALKKAAEARAAGEPIQLPDLSYGSLHEPKLQAVVTEIKRGPEMSRALRKLRELQEAVSKEIPLLEGAYSARRAKLAALAKDAEDLGELMIADSEIAKLRGDIDAKYAEQARWQKEELLFDDSLNWLSLLTRLPGGSFDLAHREIRKAINDDLEKKKIFTAAATIEKWHQQISDLSNEVGQFFIADGKAFLSEEAYQSDVKAKAQAALLKAEPVFDLAIVLEIKQEASGALQVASASPVSGRSRNSSVGIGLAWYEAGSIEGASAQQRKAIGLAAKFLESASWPRGGTFWCK